jgi:hypothetical protein
MDRLTFAGGRTRKGRFFVEIAFVFRLAPRRLCG